MIVLTHNMYAFFVGFFGLFLLLRIAIQNSTAGIYGLFSLHNLHCNRNFYKSLLYLQNRLSLFAANEKLSQLSYYDINRYSKQTWS